jgi:hypothetical protein
LIIEFIILIKFIMSEVLLVDKFLLGFFGYIVFQYGYDFWKTMIWDYDKDKEKSKVLERRAWSIDNSLLLIEEHIAEMNDKLTDIQKKVTLLDECRSMKHIGTDPWVQPEKLTLVPEKGEIEYDAVDFGVHTPEVRELN